VDLIYSSAAELISKIQQGEATSVEILEAYLERIGAIDSKIHAFTVIERESALLAAQDVDTRIKNGEPVGALAGLPLAVKDCISVKGSQTACGSKMLEGYIPPYDATVIERLVRQAGAVVIGRTNMDEFAMGSSTESSYFGPTYNPWDLTRVPGGSSGGSGAAVASSEVPVALGSDTGGSIRCPAAYCGISGIKSTYGRVSRYGLVAYANSLEQIGPLARSVDDCALLLSIMAGHDARDSTSAQVPVPEYLKLLDGDLSGIVIGVPAEFFGGGLNAEVETAVRNGVATLEQLGAQVQDVSLPHIEYALPTYYLIAMSECSSNLARFDGLRYGYRGEDNEKMNVTESFSKTRQEGFGSEVRRRIILGTYALSAGFYDMFYIKALKVRTLIKNDFQDALKTCNVLVGPTMPSTAFEIGTKVDDPLQMYLEDVLTVPINLAGVPSLSVPCGLDNSNLPIGMQIMGRFYDEETVLKVGHAFQQRTEYHKQRPEI
jgi:aspartyl-tRNA(Asn)/glutamyl-tRNA(Gln) amidotransferase subunit A